MKNLNIKINKDKRGYFLKVYDSEFLKNLKFNIDQVCISLTKKVGTIRGLHFQNSPNFERKIVICLSGKIFDVAVNLKKIKNKRLFYKSKILDSKKKNAVLIEKGFAHGFQTLEPNSTILYLIEGKFINKKQGGILWNDEKIKIKWPLKNFFLSKRDKSFKKLQ